MIAMSISESFVSSPFEYEPKRIIVAPGNFSSRKLTRFAVWMFFRFSIIFLCIASGLSLLKLMKLIVFVFFSFMSPFFSSFFTALETAVGDALRILASSLWLNSSPALKERKENNSNSSIVKLSLYISIILYTCKLRFIYFSVSYLSFCSDKQFCPSERIFSDDLSDSFAECLTQIFLSGNLV